MGLRSKVRGLLDKLIVKTFGAMSPEVEEDSWADLKTEAVEHRIKSGIEGAPPPAPVDEKKPVYRRDGQIHNFAAVPYPGSGRRLTRAQYDARYGGARPEPKHSVAGLNDIKKNDFKGNAFETPTPKGFED